jgi:translation initiation factor IF-3
LPGRAWQGGNRFIGGLISTEPRVNEQIRAREVRLVGPEGEQVGIVPLERALQLAADVDLDLVEVAPLARPPVCKLMDFGKFKYESALKAREARRNQQQTVIKEMKLRPKIDPHDYETKKGHVVRFLKAGDKVKVTIMFRGREQSRPELGFRLLRKLSEEIAELGFVEASPKQDGRNMIMVLAPHRATKVAASDAKVATAEAKATASAEAKTAAAAAKATHRETTTHVGNGGAPAPAAETVNAAATADRGAGEQ